MERLQKKQTTLRQAIDGIIAAASDLLQVPAAAIGELEECLDNLVEQADELRTVNEAIEKKIELQELDAALTECVAFNQKISVMKTKIKSALRSDASSETRSSTSSVVNNAGQVTGPGSIHDAITTTLQLPCCPPPPEDIVCLSPAKPSSPPVNPSGAANDGGTPLNFLPIFPFPILPPVIVLVE
ncbi:hypothetical protein HPB50_011885 [Hyalomma asiaticum]|uniref:Uncharacterized protein n=1 Tax=Hyalomma asiaticum TaxID=266040 RepID=A0ACB7SUP0_HYAAI|nr:hypothetical protein HPB50_011885 [Hyalomma asiaticum]